MLIRAWAIAIIVIGLILFAIFVPRTNVSKVHGEGTKNPYDPRNDPNLFNDSNRQQ